MKDLKITKGEWIYNKYEPCDYGVYSADGDGRDIALVRSKNTDEESEANAKLIAAAPDLLNALKLLLVAIDVPKRNRKQAQAELKAIDAIRKAQV